MTELLLALMLLAPAPYLPKKERPDAGPNVPCGEWTMLWCRTNYLATFRADGTCVFADPGLSREAGTWDGEWKCRGGTLYVVEWNRSDRARRFTWEAKLSSPVAGKLTRVSYDHPFAAGGEWKLEALKVKWE